MEYFKDIMKCVKNLVTSGDKIYSDVTVEVEGEIYHCHRFLLSACSPFFRAIFQSEMQEAQSNIVKLNEISSKTFKVIYDILYLHHSGLNKDNFLEVWKAAHLLQIGFIVSDCQKLAMETINERNFVKYLSTAKSVDETVTAKILQLVKRYFDKYRESDCFMDLEGEDLLSIVRDGDLKTSREENVVDTILKWIGHTTNEVNISETVNKETRSSKQLDLSEAIIRHSIEDTSSSEAMSSEAISKDATTSTQLDFSEPSSPEIETASRQLACKTVSGNLRSDYLVPLLSASRLALLSEDYLTNLYYHEQIEDNDSACDLIFKASMYRTGCKTSYWPTFARHRNHSAWEDVVLIPCTYGRILVYIMRDGSFKDLRHCTELLYCGVLSVHRGQVYTCGYTSNNQDSLTLFAFTRGVWAKATNLRPPEPPTPNSGTFQASQLILFSFSAEDHVFVVHASSRNILAWDPLRCSDLCWLTSVPGELPIIYATAFKSSILVVCGTINSVVLNAFDTSILQWGATSTLEGTRGEGVSSFHKEDKLYFLTSDAKLYVVEETGGGGVTLNYVNTFSNITCRCYGAVAYSEDLFLFVKDSANSRKSFEFPELFKHVRVVSVSDPCSPLVSTSLLKEHLKL